MLEREAIDFCATYGVKYFEVSAWWPTNESVGPALNEIVTEQVEEALRAVKEEESKRHIGLREEAIKPRGGGCC